jgi:hypothetical protein
MVREEGQSALWKGISPQLLGYCATSALRFGVFDNVSLFQEGSTSTAKSAACGQRATTTTTTTTTGFAWSSVGRKAAQSAVAGVMAGLVLSPITCASELIKCRQQVQKAAATTSLGKDVTARGTARALLSREGLRGFFGGFEVSLLRSVVGNAFFFSLFEVLTRGGVERISWEDEKSSSARRRSSPSGSPKGARGDHRQQEEDGGGYTYTRVAKGALYCGCGAVSGSATWLLIYPIDVVKTALQVHVDPATRPSAWAALAAARTRPGGLYAGVGPTILRSVPTNLVYLPGFVFFNELLKNKR